MKTYSLLIPIFVVAAVLGLCGCSSVGTKHTAGDGVVYKNAEHGIQVWKADGVDISKYSNLVVTPTISKVPEEKEEEERQQFSRLLRQVQSGIASELFTLGFVGDVKPGAAGDVRELSLDTEVVEYYRGSAALRFTVGLGAGWPTILVKGTLRENGTNVLMRFAAKRGFEARAFEFGDETILTGNIRDLAKDVAEVVHRTFHQPAKSAKK